MNCNTLVSNKMLRSFERLFLSVTLFQNGNLHIKLLFKKLLFQMNKTSICTKKTEQSAAKACGPVSGIWSCLLYDGSSKR